MKCCSSNQIKMWLSKSTHVIEENFKKNGKRKTKKFSHLYIYICISFCQVIWHHVQRFNFTTLGDEKRQMGWVVYQIRLSFLWHDFNSAGVWFIFFFSSSFTIAIRYQDCHYQYLTILILIREGLRQMIIIAVVPKS